MWARVAGFLRQARAVRDQDRLAREAAADQAAADELAFARDHLTQRPGGMF